MISLICGISETNEQRKTKGQTKKQTLNYREQADGCQRGGELRGWMKQVKGIKSTFMTSTE